MDNQSTILDANTIRDRDYEYHYRTEHRSASWWPLFLIPIAFIAGWAVNETMDRTANTTVNTRTEYGIGGAPFDATQLTPLPTIATEEPTSTPTPTPEEDQESVEDLLSPVVTRRSTQ